jgi:DNA invertase Pin-like site-specific DNA recombinase
MIEELPQNIREYLENAKNKKKNDLAFQTKNSNLNARSFAYLCISYRDQSLEQQRELIKPYNISEENIFEEKQSEKNLKYSQFLRLMSILREGDTLYIESYIRLCRSFHDFYNILYQLDTKNIKLICIKQKKDYFFHKYPNGKLLRAIMFDIIGWKYYRSNI